MTGKVGGTLYLTAGPEVNGDMLWTGPTNTPTYIPLMGDVNGDGLADAVIFNDGQFQANLTGYDESVLKLTMGTVCCLLYTAV